MDPETRKFLRKRKLGAILPWFGIIAMLGMVFTIIFANFPTLFVEVGFVALAYFLIDEYYLFVDRLTFNQEHINDHKNDQLIKTIQLITVLVGMVLSLALIYFRTRGIIQFNYAVGVIAGAFFISRIYENLIQIRKVHPIFDRNYYFKLIAVTIIYSVILAITSSVSVYLFAGILVVTGIIHVIELDIITQKRKHAKHNLDYISNSNNRR